MDTTQHDPTDTYIDENEVQDQEFEAGADVQETMSAEEAAVNIDTDVATEATDNTAETDASVAEEAEVAALDAEMIAEESETKHKNRESTAEKAKRSTRQSTAEKAKIAQEERVKQLDPLRLRGKKYKAIVGLVDKQRSYSLEEAIDLVKQTSVTTFDSAVELHIKVKGEAVRGTVTLPHGNGKTRKVAMATDEVIEAISNGILDFDVLLATPAQMPKLAKYAKVLGPKGLMPSPKAGTVTDNPEAAIAEINGGRVEYRADKGGVLHISIGKVSFPTEQVVANYRAVEAILTAPRMQSASLASTMGPGIKLSL